LSKANRFWLFSAGSIRSPSGGVCRKAFCLQNSTLPLGSFPDIFNVLQYTRGEQKAYVISCDNYPHRPPRDNDANRVKLHETGGEAALQDYLGTQNEIDFARLGQLIADFKAGEPQLSLRIMDAKNHVVHEDPKVLDVSPIQVIVLEGTWSNLVPNVDARIFLDTNFEETRAHREKRARDPMSPFTEMVLNIEQGKLNEIRERANFVINLDGEIRSGANFAAA
jgi:alpha-galactosidase